MQPLIRIDDYVNEYVNLIYNTYSKSNNVYFVNYYRIDKENSIYDEHYKDSYEDVGDWSGIRWNKIINIPIFMADPVSPQMDFSERGLNIHESTTTSALISPDVPLVPRTGDIFYTNINDDQSVFKITGVSFSGNRTLDDVYTKITAINRFSVPSSIDEQVNGIYMYIEPLHKIYPIDVATWLITVISSMIKAIKYLENDFLSHLDLFKISIENMNVSIDYEFNYYFITLIKSLLPNIIETKHIYDINTTNFTNIESSLYKLLYDDTFSNSVYDTKYSFHTDNTMLDNLRKNYYRSVKLLRITDDITTSLGNLLELYYGTGYDFTNINNALDKLLEYRINGTVSNYKSISNTPYFSRMIKYYLTLKLHNNLDTQYPEMIKHLDEYENIFEALYGLYVMELIYENLISRFHEFN